MVSNEGSRLISNLRSTNEGFWKRVARAVRRERPPITELEALKQGHAPKRVRWIDRHFPHRQLLIRGAERTHAIHFGQRLQICVAAVLALGVIGSCAVTADAAWSRHRAAKMAREMAVLRTTAKLEAERAAQDHALLNRISSELAMRIAERDKIASDPTRNGQNLADRQAEIDRLMAARESAIERALAERARVAAERDEAIAERDAALAANRDMLARLDDQARSTIADIQRIITSTGLDPNKLAPLKPPAKEDRNAPRGGPFIPWFGGHADNAVSAPPTLAEMTPQVTNIVADLDRMARLRDVLAHLPISTPVGTVEISSGYGYRIDPLNGEASLHEGIDLRAPRGTPIMATGEGVVITAGRDADFGNLVEIDHGYGLITRYGHLDRITVKRGDHVALHQQIGLMGASGRATGVHLHYETRVNGSARDPIHFLKADHYVPEKTAPTDPSGNPQQHGG